VLFCLGLFLPLPATTSALPAEVPSVRCACAGSGEAGGARAPSEDGTTYSLTPAVEVPETDKRPVNAHLLTTFVLVGGSFVASVLLMLTHARRRRGAICSWSAEEDSVWLATALEGQSFLGVFLL
jgi:hypothetical protein